MEALGPVPTLSGPDAEQRLLLSGLWKEVLWRRTGRRAGARGWVLWVRAWVGACCACLVVRCAGMHSRFGGEMMVCCRRLRA